MRYFFIFLWKHYFFFLFLIFEFISFLLIVNNNPYQRSHIINSTNELTGNMFSTFTNISEYLTLKKTNITLAEENANLHSKLNLLSSLETDSSFNIYEDSNTLFLPAKVISNSTNNRNNFLMLNKGKSDGINIDMGVISSFGIVGIVCQVSENFSSVMSVLHKDAKISAKIKKNNQLVNVIWKGDDYRTGTIEDIPTHIEVVPGDTIISSGNSLIFPEGILIGTCKGFVENTGENLNNAEIIFSTDFNSLSYVYIINNLMRKEQNNLIDSLLDE